jgi:hypothetical protein
MSINKNDIVISGELRWDLFYEKTFLGGSPVNLII